MVSLGRLGIVHDTAHSLFNVIQTEVAGAAPQVNGMSTL